MSTIDDKLKERLVSEFNHIRNQCVEPLSTFLDYITFAAACSLYVRALITFHRYSYMIDNVILLITGTLHDRDVHEVWSMSYFIRIHMMTISQLVSKCHPLGTFPAMATLSIAATPAELYNTVLVDTPLGLSRISRS